MKNKILASLLAVCLFAGLAVPAFAANVSSQSGVDADIKTTDFAKTAYTVKNGKTLEMAEEFRAFVSTKQLVQDPTVEWSIENDDKFAFNISDAGTLSAVEDAGTATVIATVNVDGKNIVAKTKVTAAKADAVIKATGFQFTDNKITAKVGVGVSAIGTKATGAAAGITPAATQTFDIVAYPKDAKFTTDQIDAIVRDFNAQKAAFNLVEGSNIAQATADANYADNKVVVSYTNGAVTAPIYTVALGSSAASASGTLTIDGVSYSYASSDSTSAIATAFVAAYTAADVNGGKRFVAAVSSNDVVLTAKPGIIAAAPSTTISASTTVTNTVTTAVAAGTANTLSIFTKDVTSKVAQVEVTFPNYNDSTKVSKVRRSATVSGKVASSATSINAAGSITIEVGEKAKVKSLFKQGPSSASVTFDQSVMQGYVDQNAQYDDYSILTGGDDYEVLGVAVGSNKIMAQITLPDGSTREAGVVVKVVEKGTKPTTPAEGTTTTVLSAWAPKIGVGETANIVVKATKAVTYTSLDTAIATVDAAGKLTAVKEGTAKIKVQEEGKDAVYVSLTVTAKTTTPGGTTDVPQTAVVALAPLF